jgi:hypothetical protein
LEHGTVGGLLAQLAPCYACPALPASDADPNRSVGFSIGVKTQEDRAPSVARWIEASSGASADPHPGPTVKEQGKDFSFSRHQMEGRAKENQGKSRRPDQVEFAPPNEQRKSAFGL